MENPAPPVAKTLPARYYTDASLFQREIERFYFERWICAGRTGQISEPGEYFLREVAGESIIITRDASAAARAFYNVCRHRGTRMCTTSEGLLPGRIQCPYHGWTYGLDGGLLGAPHMDEANFSREDYPLHAVHCDVWDGHIFINLSTRPQTLASQLAELPQKFAPWRMQDLRLHKRIAYDVKANWKLIVLNYNECLHCPLLHPALNRLTDYLGADNEPSGHTYIGGAMGFRGDAETMSMDGARRRSYLPGLNESERKKVCYYTIYPNLLLSLHPDYMMTHTLWPKAVDRTEIVCEWHFHPDEMAKPEFQANDAIDFWDMTNREDWRIVELSQAGVQSCAYTPGPYSKREELLHAFDEVVVRSEREKQGAEHPMNVGRGENPYLSVVVTARNDGHGGNMLGRMQIFVHALIAQSKRHNLASELIIVEWNPPQDRPSLRDALEWPADLGPCRVRFIIVPPALHARHRYSEALPLYQMIAKNVGIRRARGRFVLATNIDILMSNELAEYLAQQKLEAGRMYRVDRHDVMSDVPAGSPLEEQLDYCRSHLIRVNARDGTFCVTPDGRRALEARDIAAPNSGVTFGAGWFAVEAMPSESVYRCVDNEAEVFVEPLSDPPPPLIFDIEPVSGTGRPLVLNALTEGMEPSSIVLKHRTNVTVQLPAGARSFRFRVAGGGSASRLDPRVVNFRVFRCAWGGGRAFQLIRGRRPGILTRVGRRFGQVRGLLARMANAGPISPVPIPISPLTLRVARAIAGRAMPDVARVETPGGKDTAPVFLHTNGCGDFTLMAREHWLELRGYPEFELYSMNLDSVLCYTAHHGGAREEILQDPCRIYHIEHASGSGWTPEGEGKLYARLASTGVPRLDHREVMGWAAQMRRFDSTMIFNREDWGLGSEHLEETVLPVAVSMAK